ncbi:MAG: arylesterase [Candidatus Puniceispirillales bacterium]
MMIKFKYFLWLGVLLAMLIRPGDQVLAREAGETRLLVFGDSLVAGYGLPAKEAFPVRLEAMLRQKGHAVTALNGGVSGDTSAGGASRIDWALADNPDAVMVVLGGNDALRGLPPEALEANLDQVLTAIIDRGLPVLLAGMKSPANMGQSYGEAFDRAFARVVEKAKASGAKIVFYPFFLDGVALEPHLNQDDGIHPNPAGVTVIVERVLPYVETLLHETVKD